MPASSSDSKSTVCVNNRGANGTFIVVCEHSSANIPIHLNVLGGRDSILNTHAAVDIGALGVARNLADLLDSLLITAGQSRLVCDLNRSPDDPSAMPTVSEIYDIPGNINLPSEERLRRVNEIYLPFHQTLQAEIVHRLVLGQKPVLVTVHSFTPVFHGETRETELGVIYEGDPSFAHAFIKEAKAKLPLAIAINRPYGADDGVTHLLRLHATPYGLKNIMIEIRNDLISTPKEQEDMAKKLGPVLISALNSVVSVAEGEEG